MFNREAILLIFIVSILTTACIELGEHHSADYWKDIGFNLTQSGRYEEALHAYNKALEKDRNNPEIWRDRGFVLFKLERYDEALSDFNKALGINPSDADTWNDKAIVLSKLERYKEALEAFDKSLSIDPNHAMALYNKCTILASFERNEEALQLCKKAVKIDPLDRVAWNNLGWVLYKMNRYEEAIDSYNTALEIDPGYDTAWNNRNYALNKTDMGVEWLLYNSPKHSFSTKIPYGWMMDLPKVNVPDGINEPSLVVEFFEYNHTSFEPYVVIMMMEYDATINNFTSLINTYMDMSLVNRVGLNLIDKKQTEINGKTAIKIETNYRFNGKLIRSSDTYIQCGDKKVLLVGYGSLSYEFNSYKDTFNYILNSTRC
ncbi:MAG: hypothetical protein DRO62_02010 [Candidatus Altiarchaeales archaeon]|nr:MAG: hypothetical protein DRO62_02010 [Candidatus Altiarchaeales archaeon]